MTLYHDDDCEVYINGILAFSTTGYVSNYTTVDVNEEAKASQGRRKYNRYKCVQHTEDNILMQDLLEYSVETGGTGINSLTTSEQSLYLSPQSDKRILL